MVPCAASTFSTFLGLSRRSRSSKGSSRSTSPLWRKKVRAKSWQNLSMPCANNKSADQPLHSRNLISTFVIRLPRQYNTYGCYIRHLKTLAQAGLSLALSHVSEDRFSHEWRIYHVWEWCNSGLVQIAFLYETIQVTDPVICDCYIYEPRHEKNCFSHMRTTKAQSDQNLHCSLPG